jgi:hypothetical protein
MCDKRTIIHKPSAKLGHLTSTACHRVLVTLCATRRVVDGAEPVFDSEDPFEDLPVLVEAFLAFESIGLIIKTGKRVSGANLSGRGRHCERYQEEDDSDGNLKNNGQLEPRDHCCTSIEICGQYSPVHDRAS